MGFWNDLKNSVVEGVKNGAAKGVMHASGYDSNTGVIQNDAYNYESYNGLYCFVSNLLCYQLF